MKRRKKLLISVVINILLVLGSTKAMAVPELGVGTDGPYWFTPPDTFESYQDDWATASQVTSGGQTEGFEVNSGDTLYLWVTSNNMDQNDPIFSSDVYFFAEDDFTNVTFGGVPLTDPYTFLGNKDYVSSYDNPYSGINLGSVNDDSNNQGNGQWEALSTVNPLADGYPGLTYVYSGIIGYDPGGEFYFFLAADLDGNGELYDNGSDIFSPKTTSGVTPIPEPTTVLLLGIGLTGLAGGAALRKWKKKTVENS